MPQTQEQILAAQAEAARIEAERVANLNSPPVIDPPLTPPANNTGLNVDTTEATRNGLFMQALREREQDVLRLQNELNQARNAPAARQNENQWDSFTSNPRDLIRQEVTESVRPLHEFIDSFKRDQEITKIKNLYRNNPQFELIFKFAEHAVDQVLANANVINTNVMELALMTVGGAIATGRLQIPGLNLSLSGQQPPAQVPPINNTPRSNITPPETPRTTTQTPSVPQNNQQRRALTETERRLARANNQTDEAYLDLLSDTPLTVSNIPTPKK